MILGLVISACCFDCKPVTYTQVSDWDKFKPMEHNVLMPIQSAANSLQFNDNDFVPLVKASKATILAKQQTEEVKGHKLTVLMMEAVLATWPLFLIALLMAATSGCCMWILDTWFNEEEFPQRLPKGVWDGFWWAFVSMTTVGYGDKTPSSFFARLFSIIWIFLGITMFNMYTAVLTTALNVKPNIFDTVDFTNVSMGVLKGSSLGSTVVLLENGNENEFGSIPELATALENDKIKGISLDTYVAAYFMDELKTRVPLIREHHTVEEIVHAYGIISKHKNLTSFIKSFFVTNEDHSKTISSYAFYLRWPHKKLKEKELSDPTFFNSRSPTFRYTMFGLLGISLTIITIGLGCREYFKRHDKTLVRYIAFMNSEFDCCAATKIALSEPRTVNHKKKVIEDCLSELDEFADKWKTTLNALKNEQGEREMELIEIKEINGVAKT